jgi:ribosome-binding factor A
VRHQPYKRAARVAEEVRKTIAQMLLEGDLHDARLLRSTITEVKMSDDLRDGRVYFSVLGDEAEQRETLRAFHRAAGFIKTEVSHRLALRYTPELRFCYDASLERAAHLSQLIKEARALDGDAETGLEPPDESEPTDHD